MRLETKIAAVVVGVIVVAVGTWYLSFGGEDDRAGGPMPGRSSANRSTPEKPTGDAADVSAGRPRHAGPDEGTGASGSPAPFDVREEDEPSFRSGRAETFGPRDNALPSRRTGLAGDSIGGGELDSSPLDRSDREEFTGSGLDSAAVARDDSGPSSGPGQPLATTHPADKRPTTGFPRRTADAAWRPSGPRAPDPVALPEPTKTHVIQPGDTFSSLAARYLGDAKYAGRIMAANPDRDPRRLHVGSKVKIPPAPAPSAATAADGPVGTAAAASASGRHRESAPSIPPGRAYTVQTGEDWFTLAKRFLGKGTDWPRLYELNRERVPDDPGLLRAGTVIELPEGAVSTNP